MRQKQVNKINKRPCRTRYSSARCRLQPLHSSARCRLQPLQLNKLAENCLRGRHFARTIKHGSDTQAHAVECHLLL
jgi:hypothetical protein